MWPHCVTPLPILARRAGRPSREHADLGLSLRSETRSCDGSLKGCDVAAHSCIGTARLVVHEANRCPRGREEIPCRELRGDASDDRISREHVAGEVVAQGAEVLPMAFAADA